MGSTVIALVAAVVGVTGTLLAPVLAQRSNAKVQRDEFERQQQAAQRQWDREQRQAELTVRRACYIETNAAYRRYRTQLMQYLWYVRRSVVTETDRQDLEAARHAHHAAFAEAQMVASPAVLAQLDDVAKALSEGYRRIMCLEENAPDPGDTYEVIGAYLLWVWERWKEMRAVMRDDLGMANSAAGPPAVGPV